MSRSKNGITRRPEPIDERGNLKEASEFPPSSPDDAPPSRLPSLAFPSDRLPQLDVQIVKRLPGVGDTPTNVSSDGPKTNYNIDPSLPSQLIVEKTLYNLWEKTQTQTEVKWSKPSNNDQFSGMLYEIQIKKGNEEWRELAENRLPLYRVYYVEGVAIFGRQKINQDSSGMKMVRLRIRGVGEKTERGKTDKFFGPWSDDILFSLEGTAPSGVSV